MHVPLPSKRDFFTLFCGGKHCKGQALRPLFCQMGAFATLRRRSHRFVFADKKVFAFRLQGKKVRETLLYAKPAYGRAKPLHATWKMTFAP